MAHVAIGMRRWSAMMVVGFIAVALVAYLGYVLVKPEKF
ncbi:potassium-transporting ATPase subunit F [Paenibacillus athensensis]|nr:potassium-transporting ATPase subunit F [Paenibacillus athensensis]MCD1261246.1 potassium-transporting ATPase subunit F [Paenibacillus athensensis]